MAAWPTLSEIKGLRGFLGLIRCYRGFVTDYGRIAKLLTKVLRRDSFSWGQEAQSAFDALTAAMIKLPFLTVPNFSKTTSWR